MFSRKKSEYRRPSARSFNDNPNKRGRHTKGHPDMEARDISLREPWEVEYAKDVGAVRVTRGKGGTRVVHPVEGQTEVVDGRLEYV